MLYSSRKPSEVIDLSHYERKVFSQNGEDGIIVKILENLGQSNPYYVEIGVENGTECNSRYLREELGYQGLQFDKDYENLEIKLYREFITAENINELFNRYQVPQNFDLLSIDVDGNDFYLWLSLNDFYRPRVVVIEYNASHVPPEDKIVEYSLERTWDKTNYFGASISALQQLGKRIHLMYLPYMTFDKV